MGHLTLRRSLAAALRMTLALAALLVPIATPPAQAQVASGSGFASAVPCLSSPPTYATTSLANTIVAGGTQQATATDPALLQITSTSAAALAPLGTSSVPGQNTPVINGIGSTYGLAYDDGSVSGVRRLFAAAYLKRSVAFGSGGPGAIYEYRFSTGTWAVAASIPATWSGAGRTASDSSDSAIFDQVGKQGLGDLELAPDGRTLYAMNLTSRQIERYDISGGILARQTPLAIPFGLISATPAVQADLRPFALGFYPLANLQAGSGPSLVVGIIDSAERSPSKNVGQWIYPKAYVLGYNTGSGGWGFAVQQDLNQPDILLREANSTYFPSPRVPGYEQTNGWNPWRADKSTLQNSSQVSSVGVRFPQPLLTDITFSRDGQRMYVGLRDRTGDQLFAKGPPSGERVALAQGDVLTYQLIAGAWQLQGDRFGDLFDDNTHAYPGSTPSHIENFMGALGISLGGTGPGGLSEQVLGTALLGNSTSGVRTYAASGGGITSQQSLIAPSAPAGGKATALGDVEVLCSYALIGGRIWQDIDNDGIQDAGEPSVPNVALEVFQGGQASDPALATLSTDAQGRYLFVVPPNTPVNIRIAASSRASLAAQGWWLTLPNLGGNDSADSDISRSLGYIEFAGHSYGTVGGGATGIALPMPLNRSDQRNVDIGLVRVAPLGLIGDRVWDDLDHNGIQDTGEPGHAGVAVSLSPDPQSMALYPGVYPRALTTGSSGIYTFYSVWPGSYTVHFTLPGGPFAATLRDRGGDDVRDSDADASTGLSAPLTTVDESINTSIDLGLYGGAPDVWVTKSGPAEVLPGQTFSYLLDYGNAGALAADGVQLVDTLPSGLAYVSASPAPSGVVGQTLSWGLGSLAPNQSGQITLNVRAPYSIGAATSQAIANTASISTSTPYDPAGNNTSTSSGAVVRPEVSIAKSAPATALVGDEFSYTLSYANSGSIAAASVVVLDTLPPGVALTRFIQNPGASCTYTAASRRIRCLFPSLAVGEGGSVVFGARADATAAAALVNTASISTGTAGDSAANNSSTATTALQFPNPGVSLSVSPSPFPVGEAGSITASYRNSGTGLARGASLALSLPSGVALGALPGGCSYDTAARTLTCALGDLSAGAAGSLALPVALPADFLADRLDAAATITTTTPERPADQADNSAGTWADVVRPNVFVQAAGPASIVGQGSAFWYTIDYGNQYRASPTLTRDAANVTLRASLPADVSFVEADPPPTSISGQALAWDLGALAANAGGQIIVVVQTSVPAGSTLHFTADIGTTTPGDNPSDNRAGVDTGVVQPPSTVGQGQSDLRLAIHSDLDPNSRDANPANGVYISAGTQITWPAGEVLDLTPRLAGIDFPGEPLPFPYEYRARVVGWSLAGAIVNSAPRDPRAADARGLAGCRPGARPTSTPQRLAGCAYAYLGGESIGAIRAAVPPTEAQLASQAHMYWTQPPAPQMRSDVYLYTLDPLEPAQLSVQVEVEVWIVNAYPGAIGGIALPEIPVAPLPDPDRQLIAGNFDVALIVPRSVVAPGSP